MRRSSSRSVQSSGSESTTCWKVSARAIWPRTVAEPSPEQRLEDQEAVERDDERRDDDGGDGGEPAVDERPHDVAPARQQDQRDERERDAEAQHDLADDERAARVDADGEDDERRRHGDRPAQRER